ncbi:MAG: hypothetical protein QM779_09540 [Propionicimonas sp.]|uniref:hypothetical protein n=1 Tax=Propionicimonas sp. TaxID=1955623 RepID=UPI003D141CFB
MTEPAAVEPLAPGTRLLQVGPFKTGTTAIQHVASARRELLAAHGVVYPGRGLNHRWGLAALTGLTWGWARTDATGAPPRHGSELLRELGAASRHARLWLSYERLAVLDDDVATALCERIGGPVHVLVGLRPLRSLLPSEWQQLVKSGRRPGALDDWAGAAMDGIATGSSRFRHLDHLGLVDRWARVVGAGAVTCVVTDPARPEETPQALEALLGLPSGLLQPPTNLGGHRSNRSLTAAEVALLAAVARELRDRGATQADYQEVVGRGVVARLLARRPSATEARMGLGPRAAERARGIDQDVAGRLAGLGVHVRGDLAWYGGASSTGVEAGPRVADLPDSVPLEVAVAAVLGAAESALRVRNAGARVLARRLLRSVAVPRRVGRAGRPLRSGVAASAAGAGPASR